jgi:hypothetical protein
MMSSSRELLSRWQGVTDDTASCFLSLVDGEGARSRAYLLDSRLSQTSIRRN